MAFPALTVAVGIGLTSVAKLPPPTPSRDSPAAAAERALIRKTRGADF
jgi:hypothetical protein